jgi:hypothetical protein
MEEFEKLKEQKVELMFGLGGHEHEYVLHISEKDEVPYEWEKELAKELGNEWWVCHRGSRIEIGHKDSKQHDIVVEQAVRKIIGEDYTLSQY